MKELIIEIISHNGTSIPLYCVTGKTEKKVLHKKLGIAQCHMVAIITSKEKEICQVQPAEMELYSLRTIGYSFEETTRTVLIFIKGL